MLSVLLTASLILLGSPSDPIVCPNWLPGTDSVLPVGVTLSPALRLENKVRCYCEVVLLKEGECIRQGFSRTQCVKRTKDWVSKNLLLNEREESSGVPTRRSQIPRMVNVEP